MGKGICSRRQRRIFQSFLLLIFVCGTLYAFMISYEMHKELKKTEATALKYQQHQESLSAQLQVVYEHHSKLEKFLQKERLEHKKAEEDLLVFKRESQKALNKEKQESAYRLNALHTEHQILKSQHEDLKMQYYELQEKHQNQGQDHERVLDVHRLEIDNLQREKEIEISRLKENMYNLREENRQLRKAHQDIYTQLLDLQVEGYEENGKGLSPQAKGNGKKEERSTSKDRGREDKGEKAVLEHSLSNPEDLGINPRNTLSQSPGKQTQTEPLHRTKGHFEALDTVIAGNAVQSHHVMAGREDVKEMQKLEKGIGEKNLNSVNEANNQNDFEEAEEETEYKSNANKIRPEEDEQLVVASNPEQQEDQLDEQYEDETLDDSVHDRQKRAEEEESEEDPYSERNGAQVHGKLNENPEAENDANQMESFQEKLIKRG
ncbi:Golgi integral membrane protein 4-like isoform X8 [Carassius carassius]|uniref:Golgi integral membrane protein 4-like isoform X8 n=1 Tax=Carassius carassius TaxID=217509 RepID=UPI0028693A57|nr:Golgi integral membrane protein 4-like isoform X8 [Carassius carassius]